MISARCPFCDAPSFQVELVMDINSSHYVRCNKCRARGPLRHAATEAERAWNEHMKPDDKSIFEQVFGDRP